MKRSTSLPRVRRKAKPPPSATKCRPWMLLALGGILFFFGGMLFLTGLSPTDFRSDAVEIGHGSLSVTHPARQRKLEDRTPSHKFAEIMVDKLSQTEPFTIFAPSDEAFFRLSSLFKKYPEDKAQVETILRRLVGYGAVARRLPAASLAVNRPERLESVVGFPLTVAREDVKAADGSTKELVMVNEEKVVQEDLTYGSIIVHLVSNALGPEEFLDAIRGTDSEDDSMQEALRQEFGDSAVTAEGQRQDQSQEKKQHIEKVVQSDDKEDSVAGLATGIGTSGGTDDGERTTQSIQDVTGVEEKTVEVAADIDSSAELKQAESEEESASAAKGRDESDVHDISEKLTVAEVAEKLKTGQVNEDDVAVATGALQVSMDSDDRNRDQFVKEGLDLLEKPGESGGEQREEAEAKADAEVAAAADQKGRSEEQGGGAGWSKQEFGLSGIGWWNRKTPTKSDTDQTSSRLGLGWLGFGSHVSAGPGDASNNRTNTSDSAVSAPNANVTVSEQVNEDLVLGPDPLDNLPKLLKLPPVEDDDFEGQVVNKTGSDVDGQAGLAGSRNGMNGSQAEQEALQPATFCNNRGFVDRDKNCQCAVLFAGRNCEKIADTSKFALEPYIGPLAWSRSGMEYKSLGKTSAESAFGDKNKRTSMQPQHLHPMTTRLLEEISKEEREELEKALPRFDPLSTPAWESCAVVGNSGALLLRDDGEEIDRHEMVMRFNAAPTIGYEKQVGSKTTHRLSEVQWVGFVERNETVIYHLWLRAQKEELRHLLRFKHVFPETAPFILLDLGFSAQILSTLGTIPSSGLVGISFAMQKCKRVDLYGFGLNEKHGMRHHYFNRNTTVKGVERGVEGLDKEFDAIIELADAELLWIADPCLFDCQRSMQKCSRCMRLPVDELSERSDPTEQQAALNRKREERWKKFLQWHQIEKDMQFRKQALESKRKSLARRNKTAAHRKEEEDIGSDSQANKIDWGRLIEEDRIEELPLNVLLTYFRINHVTIPDTKKQMLMSIKSHYYFSHGQLHKQTNRLYRPSD